MEEMKKISGYLRNRVTLKSNNGHFFYVPSNRESF